MAGMTAGGLQSPRAETTTWLTPPSIIKALGPFDLDPCAAPSPRPWPTAYTHIELPVDGLAAPWFGRVWCNPPYGREAALWVEKLALHGRGTMLIFARTETKWFQPIWDRATAILFMLGRVTFHYPDGTPAAANGGAPSVLVAFGEEDAKRLESAGIPGQFIRLRSAPVYDGVFA